jgi:hypothetical protein
MTWSKDKHGGDWVGKKAVDMDRNPKNHHLVWKAPRGSFLSFSPMMDYPEQGPLLSCSLTTLFTETESQLDAVCAPEFHSWHLLYLSFSYGILEWGQMWKG